MLIFELIRVTDLVLRNANSDRRSDHQCSFCGGRSHFHRNRCRSAFSRYHDPTIDVSSSSLI